MKKLFLLTAITGLLSLSLFSAATAQEKFDYGARVGLNISNYSFSKNNDNSTTSAEIGILGGLQMDYWFTPKWAFCAQLLYIQKGAKNSFSSTVGTTTFTGTSNVVANYLEIPLEAKLQFGEDSKIRAYIFAGPTVGLLLSATANSTVNGGSSTSDNVKDQFSSTDFGIIGGAGLNFFLSDDLSLFLEAGYNYGFANVQQDSQPTAANTRDIHIAAGILFH